MYCLISRFNQCFSSKASVVHTAADLTSQSTVWRLLPAAQRKVADGRSLPSLGVQEGQHHSLPGGGDTALSATHWMIMQSPFYFPHNGFSHTSLHGNRTHSCPSLPLWYRLDLRVHPAKHILMICSERNLVFLASLIVLHIKASEQWGRKCKIHSHGSCFPLTLCGSGKHERGDCVIERCGDNVFL